MSKVSVYDNYDKKNRLDYYEESVNEKFEINFENYSDKASTYIYTFKEIDGNYFFDSLKRVN